MCFSDAVKKIGMNKQRTFTARDDGLTLSNFLAQIFFWQKCNNFAISEYVRSGTMTIIIGIATSQKLIQYVRSTLVVEGDKNTDKTSVWNVTECIE